MVSLRIIIVNYNVRHFILQCIESIYRSDHQGIGLSITVVDNNSIDGSVAAIRNKYPSVEVISSKINLGFGKANNIAIQNTNTDYCLLLNPDTIIQEDTLRKCIDYMDLNSNVASLGVKMVDGNGNYLRESKRSLPSPLSSFFKISKLNDLFKNSSFFNSYYTKDLTGDLNEKVDVLCGAFMFCKTERLKELGGFDEAFFMYGEDIDLSKRILEAGYENHYLGNTRIIHFKGESSKKASFNYIHSFYNAMIIYVNKHYKGTGAILTKFLLKFAIIFAGLLRSIKEVLFSFLQPLIDFALIFIALNWVKDVWSQYYFGVADYYDKGDFIVNSLFYTTIWVSSLWFWGWYDGYRKIKSLFYATFFGTITILICYALFPMQYRSSRVLIILGSIISIIVPIIIDNLKNRLWKYRSTSQTIKSNVIIVGEKSNAVLITSQLNEQKYKYELIGIVNPDATSNDSDYLNNINYLTEIVKMYDVDEVIFSHKDISAEKIMDLMTISETRIKYKIADVNSQHIIGSEDNKTQGKIYDTFSKYNLSKAVYRRIKRISDILFTLLFTLLMPIFSFIPAYRNDIFPNLFSTLIGRKTFVGYNNQFDIHINLPSYKESIIRINENIAPKEYPHFIEKNINNWYSMNYTPFIDMEIIKNFLF